MKNIWILAEQACGTVHASYFELLGKAKEIYPGETLTAVVMDGGEDAILPVLKSSGVDSVIRASHEKLASYHPDYCADTLVNLAKTYDPDVIFAAATPIGSELAPTVAAKLGTGLAAHCADLCVDEKGGLVTIIPAFGGKLLGEIMIPEKRPAMATVKPGVFARKDVPVPASVTVIDADVSFLDTASSKITPLGIEAEAAAQGKIEEAEIVVCAGLGIRSHENWEKIDELAALLQGAVGYTRPMVDMGYIDHEEGLIGTSGKMIHPKLYIGFGVSGATHHVCGMKDSALVININSDEKAPAFDVSDYKLVGDSGAVLDELLSLLKS